MLEHKILTNEDLWMINLNSLVENTRNQGKRKKGNGST